MKIKFEDIEFEKHPNFDDGIQSRIFFENGYGVSIVKFNQGGFSSYGASLGLYEIAVLKGDINENRLCYDTPITSDVIGHLDEKDVEVIIEQVSNL